MLFQKLMIPVLPDYQGVVYSPNPKLFAQLLVGLFGGIASHPNDDQSFWELPGTGKWKIQKADQASAHIPLRLDVDPNTWRDLVVKDILPGIGFTMTGENHWRLFDFNEIMGNTHIGFVHLANRR